MVCTHDLQGILLSVNTHGAQTIGRAREDLIGHRLSEFMPEDRRAEFDQYLGDIALNGEVQGLLHLCHVNGGVRVLAFRNKLIQTPARDPYVLGFGIDISEQVHAEDKLRALMRQSNSVLESVGDGIYGIDLEGICTVVNPAASQMLGFKPEELLGRNMHSLIHHTRADGAPYPRGRVPHSKHHPRPRHRPHLQRSLLAQGRNQLPGRVRRTPPDRNRAGGTDQH